MSSTERRRGSGDAGGYLIAGLCGVYLLIGCALWAGVQLDQELAGSQSPVPQPFALPIELLTGTASTSRRGLIVAAVLLLLLVVPAAWLAIRKGTGRKPNRHIDRAAQHMGRGSELERLTRRTTEVSAARLNIDTATPGLRLGRAVAGNTDLWADWESSAVGLAGARVGKTTNIVIPWIMAAPGACIVTSNRRDVVDGTRGARPGSKYVFDPQQIVGEHPAFYVDFLQSYVMSGPQGSEVKADALAGIFATATAPPDSRSDRFFDPNGQKLLAHFLHSAALDGLPMTRIYEWLTDHKDRAPAHILARHGFDLSAKAVLSVMGSPDKQRGGIYATAELCVSWLTNRAAVEWLTPRPGRPMFDPAQFAASADTLYLISKEGRGTLSALTTALTAMVCEAAEHLASRSPGGRLPVPMCCILDEAANVCRWPDLPDVFSHYGGRGIFLLTIIQSWSQGVGVWGERGMTAMWSTAAVNLFLGGVREVKLLRELGELIGTYRARQVTSSSSRNGRSTNYSEVQEDILSTADLGALPRGRAIMLASGVRPTLLRIIPWWDTEHAGSIRYSQSVHDPNPGQAAAEAKAEAEEWDVAPAGAGWSR